MGHKTHSYKEMKEKREERIRSKGDFFSYDRTVRSSSVKEVHASLNPAHGGLRHINEGELISVLFDVTGSYRTVPREVQGDLPELFARLVTNKWVPNKLNLQFGAIGDVNCDTAPLQLSQAETDGVTADKWLSNLYLEGGGGGGAKESYELAFWALANQNKFYGWENGRKGNAFIIFDELPYSIVSPSDLLKMYSRKSTATINDGDQLSAKMMRDSLNAGEDSVALPYDRIATEQMAEDLMKKYDVWCIIIKGTGYWQNAEHLAHWRGLFGNQSVIELHNASNISELISGIVGSKYQHVSDVEIQKTVKTSVEGAVDMRVIEGAMANVKSLPATIEFNPAPFPPLPGNRSTRL